MTIKKAWDYFMNRSLKPKADSRVKPKAMTKSIMSKDVDDSIRYMYAKEMPDKSSICTSCKKPYSQHKWNDDKQMTIHPGDK